MDNLIAEGRKMLDGVTPGPWRDAHDENSCVFDADGLPVGFYISRPNRRFIVWTREGVPALLARLEAAEAKLTQWDEQDAAWVERVMLLTDRIEAAEAKLARIEKAWPLVRDADCSGGDLIWASEEIDAALQGEG